MSLCRNLRDPRWLMVQLTLAILFMISVPASAQPDSPAAMRQRIATLEDELESLKSRLDAVTDERDRLKIEIEQLRQAMVDGGASLPASVPAPRQRQAEPGDSPPSTVPISALSREPLDSPDALFIALLLDYRETLLESDAPGVIPDANAVGDWVEDASKKYEGTTNWLVRIDGIVRNEKGPDGRPNPKDTPRRMLATVLDPTSAAPISRPAMVTIPRRFDGRFPDRLGEGEVLYADMRVKVEADCVHQPGRLNEGPFNYPPFLGPHAGFGYTVDIVGLKFETFEDIRVRMRSVPSKSDR